MKVPRHSTGDAFAALLLGRICPLFSLVAPCYAGASPVSVPHATFTTGSDSLSRLWSSAAHQRPPRPLNSGRHPISSARPPAKTAMPRSMFGGRTP